MVTTIINMIDTHTGSKRVDLLFFRIFLRHELVCFVCVGEKIAAIRAHEQAQLLVDICLDDLAQKLDGLGLTLVLLSRCAGD